MTLIYLAGMGIWGVLTLGLITLILLFAFVANEMGIGAFMTLMIGGGLLLFGTEPRLATAFASIPTWAYVAGGACSFAAGLVYSFWRFHRFSLLISRAYEAMRVGYLKYKGLAGTKIPDEMLREFRRFCVEGNIAQRESGSYSRCMFSATECFVGEYERTGYYRQFLNFDHDGKYLEPTFTDHFRRILFWAIWWPFDGLVVLLRDFVQRIFEEMVISCKRVYQKISERNFKRFSEDLRDAPPEPPAPAETSGPTKPYDEQFLSGVGSVPHRHGWHDK